MSVFPVVRPRALATVTAGTATSIYPEKRRRYCNAATSASTIYSTGATLPWWWTSSMIRTLGLTRVSIHRFRKRALKTPLRHYPWRRKRIPHLGTRTWNPDSPIQDLRRTQTLTRCMRTLNEGSPTPWSWTGFSLRSTRPLTNPKRPRI